jgi:hypothetical protein
VEEEGGGGGEGCKGLGGEGEEDRVGGGGGGEQQQQQASAEVAIKNKWPAKSSTQLCCHLCCSHSQRKGTVCQCSRCGQGLCVVPCFAEYHTKVNL